MSTVNDAPLIIDNIRPQGTRPSDSPSRADQAKPAAEDEASFWDFLDVINPLQHIPIVSTIYREITGDTIKPVARLAGGALFGGVIGAGLAAVSAAAEGMMGLNNGESMLASLFGGDGEDGARPSVNGGPQVARQAIGAAPEDTPSPAQVIARYAQPVDAMSRQVASAQAAASAPGATMPASAMPFLAQDAARPSALAAARQAVENGPAPAVAPPEGVMPARAAALKAPETADRSKKETPQAPDAVQRALEAQGLSPDAASHPMIQALAAGNRVSPSQPSLPATAGMMAGGPAAAPAGQAPQQMPGWFDQAMTQALDRYEQTGRLNQGNARSAAAANI